MNKDCHLYNDAPENELPKMSKKLVDSIKQEIRRTLNSLDEFQRNVYEESKSLGNFHTIARPAGKLTVPLNKVETSLEEFRR
jgi:hypothetical protein